MRLFFISILLLFCSISSYGQLALSPSSVFIDPQTNSATMQLKNKSKERKEISISFDYGYLDYNSQGKAFINYDDTLTESRFSLSGIIRAIPQKMYLNPGEETIIMLKLKEHKDWPDGTYFTRVIIETSNASSNLGDSTGKLESGFGINIKIVGAVLYMKGNVNTSIDITNIGHTVNDSILDIALDLQRQNGNSPFLGKLDAIIFDIDNNAVDSLMGTYCSVYFNGKIILSFDRSRFKPGRYHAVITADTERGDIPKKYIIPADKVLKNYNFEIPE